MNELIKSDTAKWYRFCVSYLETIILSFILDNISYKKPYFYAKNMEVMDKTVI